MFHPIKSNTFIPHATFIPCMQKSAKGEAAQSKQLNDHQFVIDAKTKRAVKPLKFDIFGQFGYFLMLLVSILWPCIYIVVLYDYYYLCQLKGIDNLCFYGEYPIFGNYDTNSEVLFTIWLASSLWYGFWLSFYGKIINWFRVEVSAE